MTLSPSAPSQSKPYTMVVGVDFGKLADRAFTVGYGMCRLHSQAALHVLSVVNEVPDSSVDPETSVAAASLSLEQSAKRLAAHVDALLDALGDELTPAVHVISHVMIDVPVLAITGLARDLEADMIVVGTHGRRGLARWLLGSVAEGILRHASCPVFVIPPTNDVPPLILDDPCTACIAARASSEGKELWCPLHRGREGRRHTHHRSRETGGD